MLGRRRRYPVADSFASLERAAGLSGYAECTTTTGSDTVEPMRASHDISLAMGAERWTGRLVITRLTMMEPLLKASPRFAPVWECFVEEWKDETEELPLYLVLGDLARLMASLYQEGAETELLDVFAVVEAWHLEGDVYVKQAATIGLLEDLQNTNVVAPVDPAAFVRFLGPESKRWWIKVERFWERGELIRDDQSAVSGEMKAWEQHTREDYEALWTPFDHRFEFRPSMNQWPGFREPADSITYQIDRVYGDPERYNRLTLDLCSKLVAALRTGGM